MPRRSATRPALRPTSSSACPRTNDRPAAWLVAILDDHPTRTELDEAERPADHAEPESAPYWSPLSRPTASRTGTSPVRSGIPALGSMAYDLGVRALARWQ
ncbi:hypothetical protein [Streptomyces anthocyanicus]|uniref:hypothetical protein n=1 Tax=Streptomyces anthocyanicus TaxID=68174 RepID=UPI003643DB7E